MYLKDLPSDFIKKSFDDKSFKVNNGEALSDVDNRLQSFLKDILNNKEERIVIVMHGIILLSYLQTICDYFEFDGANFNISYHDNIVLNGKLKNPSIYKVEFNDNKDIVNVESIKCD